MKVDKIIFRSIYLSVLFFILTFEALAQTDIENELYNEASKIEASLTDAQIADFSEKTLRKTKALSNYISTIGNNSIDIDQRNRAIDLAVKLFMKKDNIVEVSSLNNESNQFKIKDYLVRLRMLHYSKVTIEWYNVFFASNFKKNPDNKYEAVVTIYQRFNGITNEGERYFDITKKNIQVILEQIEIEIGDTTKTAWEVLLGDIKVEETSRE